MSRPKANDQTNKRRDGSATVYLQPHMLQWLKDDADRAGRCFSNYLSRIIETYATHAGYQPCTNRNTDLVDVVKKQLETLLENLTNVQCFAL